VSTEVTAVQQAVRESSRVLGTLVQQVERLIVGQRYVIDRLLIGLLTGGHVLLEGLPGLAKTLAVRSMAGAIRAEFRRIQFTPDLLPADLIGTQIYNPRTGEFTVKRGPIFANIILADEINRAPPKVQSALLEAMQEKQVTIGDQTFPLEEPFLVLATQNPIEQEGTYPLPEAQVDRFMLKLRVGYPNRSEERQILDRMAVTDPPRDVAPVLEPADILRLRTLVDTIYIDDKVKDYIVSVVQATRDPGAFKLAVTQYIRYGASPRATINLTLAAKAHAFLAGRGYVTPQDVKSIGMDVLRHRVIVSYEAEAEEITSEEVVNRVFDTVEVP
jgi:MoxR-like ATPase